MTLNLTKNEMWKIIDAVTAYQKDYAVNGVVQKTLKSIQEKLHNELKK